MLSKTNVYKTSNGTLESDPKRAYAWELTYLLDKIYKKKNLHLNANEGTRINFSAALEIIESYKEVIDLLNEYKVEIFGENEND